MKMSKRILWSSIGINTFLLAGGITAIGVTLGSIVVDNNPPIISANLSTMLYSTSPHSTTIRSNLEDGNFVLNTRSDSCFSLTSRLDNGTALVEIAASTPVGSHILYVNYNYHKSIYFRKTYEIKFKIAPGYPVFGIDKTTFQYSALVQYVNLFNDSNEGSYLLLDNSDSCFLSLTNGTNNGTATVAIQSDWIAAGKKNLYVSYTTTNPNYVSDISSRLFIITVS